MIIDYLAADGLQNLDTDVCIMGAGVAGIALARAFIGTSTRVCLIEGGGLAGECDSQDLYEGDSVGCLELPPASTRMRAFGGSCRVWGGGCIPMDSWNMQPHDWIPHSGWPIDHADLQPYYRRSQAFCGIDGHHFTDGSFLTAPGSVPIGFDPHLLVNRVFVRTGVIFDRKYRAELARAPNITIVLHANLVELQATDDGRSVDCARIASLRGRRGAVRARHYVLACGAIENARQLLASDSVVPHGLGNGHDLVGRFFMDHPAGRIGAIHSDTPDMLTSPYDRSRHAGAAAAAYPEIGLSPQFMRARRVLNARVRPTPVESPLPGGIEAWRRLHAALRALGYKPDVVEQRIWSALDVRQPDRADGTARLADACRLVWRMGRGSGDILTAFGRKLAHRPTVRTDHIDLIGYFEQAPNPDSRITLGRDRDALGQRRVVVDWQPTAIDRHTWRTAGALFGAELARACAGRFQPEPWLAGDATAVPRLHGTAHHMGTTRMADDPHQGVVDRHCRVHGVDNLHIAGSSVFPTVGWAFPTFTIVALSLRLADRLQSLAADRGASVHYQAAPHEGAAA